MPTKYRPFCLWLNVWRGGGGGGGGDNITMTSLERHVVSNHQELDCLFDRLFWLTAKKASIFRIRGPL